MKFTIRKAKRITGGYEFVIHKVENDCEIGTVRIPYKEDITRSEIKEVIKMYWDTEDIVLIAI